MQTIAQVPNDGVPLSAINDDKGRSDNDAVADGALPIDEDINNVSSEVEPLGFKCGQNRAEILLGPHGIGRRAGNIEPELRLARGVRVFLRAVHLFISRISGPRRQMDLPILLARCPQTTRSSGSEVEPFVGVGLRAIADRFFIEAEKLCLTLLPLQVLRSAFS